MHILHYSLGLPPYRSGGLTKYATDLMIAQVSNGDVVSLLYPGDYIFWLFSQTLIKKNNGYKGISVFEIKNPSPVPLLHGVVTPNDIRVPRKILSGKEIKQFFNSVNPDVFHIHTLMGLPHELILYFREKGVKIIFTSHDCYGLCLKVNFINQNGVFCESPGGIQCALCNKDAPSSLFLRLRNSKYLLRYKTKLKSIPIKIGKENIKELKDVFLTQKRCSEYDALLIYYRKFFDLIDCFHFNSNVSRVVYERYLTPKQSIVLPISHFGIKDFRRIRKIDKNHIKLAFIGSTTTFKGYQMLKNVLYELNKRDIRNWKLQVWGSNTGQDRECDKIMHMGQYSTDDLHQVFNELDLLIVPSICNESFSLITLEALSYGVPVLVSTNVGAKDIIAEYNPDFVFIPIKEVLYSKLRDILNNPVILEDYNRKICANKFEYSLEDHCQKIKQLYQSIIPIR